MRANTRKTYTQNMKYQFYRPRNLVYQKLRQSNRNNQVHHQQQKDKVCLADTHHIILNFTTSVF